MHFKLQHECNIGHLLEKIKEGTGIDSDNIELYKLDQNTFKLHKGAKNKRVFLKSNETEIYFARFIGIDNTDSEELSEDGSEVEKMI